MSTSAVGDCDSQVRTVTGENPRSYEEHERASLAGPTSDELAGALILHIEKLTVRDCDEALADHRAVEAVPKRMHGDTQKGFEGMPAIAGIPAAAAYYGNLPAVPSMPLMTLDSRSGLG